MKASQIAMHHTTPNNPHPMPMTPLPILSHPTHSGHSPHQHHWHIGNAPPIFIMTRCPHCGKYFSFLCTETPWKWLLCICIATTSFRYQKETTPIPILRCRLCIAHIAAAGKHAEHPTQKTKNEEGGNSP